MKFFICLMCTVLFIIQHSAHAESRVLEKDALLLLESMASNPPSFGKDAVTLAVGEALRGKASEEALETITKLMGGSVYERQAYASSLKGDPSLKAFEQIKLLLNDDSYSVREVALTSLAGNTSPEAMQIISDNIDRYRGSALEALVGNYSPQALDLIEEFMSTTFGRRSDHECSLSSKCDWLLSAIKALKGHSSPKAFSIMKRIAYLNIIGEGIGSGAISYQMAIHQALFPLVAGDKSPEALEVLKLLENREDVLKSLIGNTSPEALGVVEYVWKYVGCGNYNESGVLVLNALQGHKSPEAFELIKRVLKCDTANTYGSIQAAAAKALGSFVN